MPPRGHGRGFYWFLLAMVAAAGLFLVAADKPWDERLTRLTAMREAAGKPWKVEQLVTYDEWLAALGNLVLAVALFATLRRWARPLEKARPAPAPPGGRGGRRWLLLGLGAAVLIGAHFRAQRLDHSFWSDEEYTFRTHIWGQMEEGDDGALVHQPVPWRDTLFRNKANNHIGFTAPARVLHAAWANGGRPVVEAAVRILPFLSGLAAIALAGFLVARYAGVLAGVGVALLWALVPWPIQYASDARGYSQMLLFLLAAFLFLGQALESHRWRDWLAFGLAEFLVMLSYPGAAYVLAIANAMAFGHIWWGMRGEADRSVVLGRLVIVNLLSGMLFLQIFAPSIPQVLHYLKHGPLHGEMSVDWFRHVWVYCSTGLPVDNPWPAEHLGASFLSESGRLPGYWAFHLPVMLGLVAVGAAAAARRHRALLIPGLATLLGVGLSFAHNSLSGTLVWPGYVVFIVIGFCLFAVIGTVSLASLVARTDSRRQQVAAALLASFLALYAATTARARSELCTLPTQPIRQAVELARGESPAHGDGGGLLTGSFGTSRGMVTTYDPRARVLKSEAALLELISEARRSNKRLRIYLCGRRVAEGQEVDGKILAIVENPDQFRTVGAVLARSELFSYHVYEWIGDAHTAHTGD